MARIKPERAHYIAKGARRVQHKHSSAVAYVGKRPGWLLAVGFHGRAQKPDFNYRYPDNERGAAQREARIREHFAQWQERESVVRDRRCKPHGLEVGDVLRSSWGYDQTNIDFYEVVKLVGASMVEIRELEQAATYSGQNMTGKCVPLPGSYKGDPMRKRASEGSVRIASYAWAHKVEPQMISGVPVYESSNYSSYA